MNVKQQWTSALAAGLLLLSLAPTATAAEPDLRLPQMLESLWGPVAQMWEVLGEVFEKAGPEICPDGTTDAGPEICPDGVTTRLAINHQSKKEFDRPGPATSPAKH